MNAFATRRDFLRTLGLGAASLVTRAAWAADRPRPNFLFLFTDDQRFSALGALNNPHVRTPHIDRLTRRGVTFTHAFIQGSTSGAVCICSRAMLISGRSLFRSPYRPSLGDGLALWPETFRQAGYQTFGTGKWHNGRDAFARSFTHGGKIFFGGMCNHLKVPVFDFDPSGQYPKSKRYTGDKFSSELFSDAAIDFLNEQKPGKPFFAYVSFTAPHDPRMAPKEFADAYPPAKIPIPPNFLPEHPFDNGELRIRDEKLAPWPRTPEIVREHIAAYYAMISHTDAQIGRVLKALHDNGLADNTIVIFAGDNGLALGQHGLMGKQNLYDHSVRVPLVLAGPGLARGQRIDALCYLHDLFPTTCELAGLRVPDTVESASLAPLLAGTTRQGRDSVFGAYRHLQRMVRTPRWKLVRYPYANKTQLFDMQADPWETKDLSADPQQAARIAELNAQLKRWQQRVGDKLDLEHPPERGAGSSYRPGIPVKPDQAGAFVLTPNAAKLSGALCYQPKRNNLGAWFNYRDCPEWRLVGVKAGTYEVEFAYGSVNPGVPYSVVVGEAQLAGKTLHTGGMKTYQAFRLGTVDLPAGDTTVVVRPGKFTRPIMNFRLLTLRPVGE